MLPQDFIYALKQANPIEGVMSSYVQLQRAGSLMKCLCPFHSEKTPSCVVYTDTQDQHFYCFGCHAGGDVITFIMQIEGLSYMDAVQMLAERAGMTVPRDAQSNREAERRTRLLELNRTAARFYYDQLRGQDKRGLVYLRDRALSPQIINKYGLGYAGDSSYALHDAMLRKGFTDQELIDANLCSVSSRNGKIYDRFRNRVIFPIFDLRGSVIAFGGRTIEKDGEPKYLNSSDTPVFKKGHNLFSMQFAKKSQSKRLILAEGYMDVIAIHQAGFENVVASLGTALTPDQCRLMRQYAEEVVISYDSDAAGQNATVKAINLLRAVGLRPRILHMHDAKDPDEFIKKFGPPAFRVLLEDADDAMTFELERCKTGTDTDTEDGKIAALQKAVAVLADIENDMQRDIYLSRVAHDYGIEKEILSAQVDTELRKRRGGAKKQAWRNVQNAALTRDPVNPDAVSHRREAMAEETILCYLFRNPDMLEKVQETVPPEHFVTAFNKRVYTFLSEQLLKGYTYSLSLFGEDFTPQEIAYITRISVDLEQVEINDKTVSDCAEILNAYQADGKKAEDLDNTEFSAKFDALRRKRT